MWLTARTTVLVLSTLSGLAMLYVGAYQVRAIDHLKCPLLKHGCETVADAPFARPFGIPDGFIAAGMYGLLILLAVESPGARYAVRGVALLAVLANVLGVVDMTRLGAYCFFCLLTTVLSPFLAWAAFVL